MRYIFHLLLPLLLLSTALLAQAPVPIPAPNQPPAPTAELAAARPPSATDTGAVLLFNGWYLPAFQPTGAAADTTGALLSLFRKRRYAGWLYAVPFIVGLSVALPLSSSDRYGQRHVAAEAISPPLGAAILGATVVGFVRHATKFNRAHLVAVAQAYAAGQPIPARYRSQLNANHFAEAAYLREAIAQQKTRERLTGPR